MLRIPNLTVPAPEVETPFKFPLDPFQKYAVAAISNDENVLVTAKTGSGKTLVGEFQIWHSLNKGKRVFYTTPIKSLSNQKFHDLKKIYGDRVGIMTGDIKFCPHADIVIMTTEILRNLLFKQGTSTESVGVTANLSLQNLDAVVFDEVHYMNDRSRGKVWEECLTLLPPSVNLVLLSATIDQPETFANWLGDIKQKPIHLISTEYRIVPLVHMTEDGDIIMDSKDKFYEETYSKWLRKQSTIDDELRRHKDRVRAREEGQDAIEKTVHKYSFVERMNRMIMRADLPALFFVFSREKCRTYADAVTSTLITPSESAAVHHIVKFHLRNIPNLEKMDQYHSLLKLLEKGIAYHHSGLLPVLKEIVEILFDRGLIKVLFATETFAVGINMPTKTVVFTSFTKFDDQFRMLTTSEYIQMAGRAGRRGKDDKGFVYYLPIHKPEDALSVRTMMTGKRAYLESKMDFGYSYILSSMQAKKDIQTQTFWYQQRKKCMKEIEDEIADLKFIIPELNTDMLRECKIRESIENILPQSVNADRKKFQGDLNRWNNSHMGPKWVEAWKTYKLRANILKKLESLETELKQYADIRNEIDGRICTLQKYGYVENDVLTPKGILASELHEGHPLLMSHMFHTKMIHNESTIMIIRILSMFLEKPHEEFAEETNTLVIRDYKHDIDAYARLISNSEIVQSDVEFWDTTLYWADPVFEWMTGNDFVCEQYGIEQGNFVRAMLKLSNILEEWTNMAILSQDVDMVEKMKDVRNLIVRSFVIPDSLYLRI